MLCLATCAVASFLQASPAGAATARLRVEIGRAPALPAGARTTGALAAATQVHLSIALRPRDPAGLQAFATAVSTPGSPQFRHYLSVGQFAGRYGATSTAIAAVQSALRSQGLTVGAPMANHLTLQASGAAAAVEQAFGTRLSNVQLASGRIAYANTTAPLLPPAVAADIQGVIGLNDLVKEHHPEAGAPASPLSSARAGQTANVATGGPQPCAAATAETTNVGGYTADSIAAAYGFSSLYGAGDLGAGQTIALYELQPYNATDVSTYQSCYSTAVPITNVGVDSPPAFASGDDDTEAALDIEQLIGLAPAAKIIVYDAPNSGAGPIDEYSAIVSQDQAKVVSSSWGECENDFLPGDTAALQAENTLFQEAAAQGQSIYVASGDDGSATCLESTPSSTKLSVSDPAAQPFATGVGGTTLFSTDTEGDPILWAPGDTLDQSVWNDGADLTANPPSASASGGGISSFWAMPSYQSGAAASAGVINSNSSGTPCGMGSTLCREVPDVSAEGDPDSGYVVFTDGGWGVVGGTSAAAPLWAAFTGLVNADPSCNAKPVGFVNPALYRLAGTAYASNISDVTLPSPITGMANNDALGDNSGLFPVGPGYDMATGLGTPISPRLATSLCGVFTVTVANPGARSATVGAAQSLQIQATDGGGVPLTYTATGLPAGLTINSATGLISGTPASPGTSTVTVSASDSLGNTGAAQFTWTIAAAPAPPTPTPGPPAAAPAPSQPPATTPAPAGASAAARPAARPKIVSAPKLTGRAAVGSIVRVRGGRFTNGKLTKVGYYRCTGKSTRSCKLVHSSRSLTYKLSKRFRGASVRARVTVSGNGGSVTAWATGKVGPVRK